MIKTLFHLISRIPLRVLYAISDVIYILLYYIIRYRRGIVRKNLTTSFPEKSKSEIKHIEREFYRWLCDYFVETAKLINISDDEMRRRTCFNNIELVDEAWDRGQNISIFMGHYCNWEWLSDIGLFTAPRHANAVKGLIYHALRNETTDALMLDIRSSHGGKCINKRNILREIVTLKRNGINYLMGYIFDQGPRYENIHLWMPFLNHNTGVFTGAERLTRKFNEMTFFLKVERPKRGYYTATLVPVTATPNELPEYELTKRCMQLLEESIKEAPQFYLWTHNRWKRTYEGYQEWAKEHESR